MKREFDIFLAVLEKSVKKHGPTTVLTLGHILNICKLVRRVGIESQEADEIKEAQIYNDVFGDGQD